MRISHGVPFSLALLAFGLFAAACDRDDRRAGNPDATPHPTPPAIATTPCVPGPGGHFVVTDDSVGPFKVAGTQMGEVLRRCGSDTAMTSRCCYMTMTATVRSPGVLLEGDQESTLYSDTAHVDQWEVSGDSIYLAGDRLLPKTVAGLASLGVGYAENPDYDDNDGPQAHVCALRNLAFRISAPAGTTRKTWRIDSSEFNRQLVVTGIRVARVLPTFHQHCLRTADTVWAPTPSLATTGARARCLPGNAFSDNARKRIVLMVTSAGAAADSGRVDAHLPLISADSVSLVATDSLCARAATARADKHGSGTSRAPYPLWLFRVGDTRYVAVDVEYNAGEFRILDVLDRSFAILGSIAS